MHRPTHPACLRRGPLLLGWLLVLSSLVPWAAARDLENVPHVDSCNFCGDCVVDTAATAVQFLQSVPPGINDQQQPHPGYAPLLQPPDVESKALLPNCTVCRGCNMQLWDISSRQVKFQNVQFQHGKGATNSRIFFARTHGSDRRFILKVYCIPISKLRRNKSVTCSVKMASERIEILIAQQKLLQQCGMQEIVPQLWLVNVSAILPESGYHIHWTGLLMEEAQGITLHGLYASKENRLALELLQNRLNKTQVQLGAIWDLLTSQCDRHAENIFINQHGNLQYIDNDKALGVVTRCGFDTMLLPGTRYHSVLRIGFWRQLADYYRHQRLANPQLCRGMIDPRFVIDYRCTTPTGTLGTAYPPSFTTCARRLSGMTVPEIMAELGLTNAARAEALKSRSTDMVERGFEWTMENGFPLNSPRFRMPKQPACCGLAVANRMIVCDQCWQPLLPEDFSNSTDLALVTSLVDNGPRAARGPGTVHFQRVQVTQTVTLPAKE